VIANVIPLRAFSGEVVYSLAFGARAASAEASDDRFKRKFVAQDCVETNLPRSENLRECLGLHNRSRETIQQKPAAATQATRPLRNQRQYNFIGHQLSRAHAIQCALHSGADVRRGQFFGTTEYVTGREMANA
jgi:hypothetical protein